MLKNSISAPTNKKCGWLILSFHPFRFTLNFFLSLRLDGMASLVCVGMYCTYLCGVNASRMIAPDKKKGAAPRTDC